MIVDSLKFKKFLLFGIEVSLAFFCGHSPAASSGNHNPTVTFFVPVHGYRLSVTGSDDCRLRPQYFRRRPQGFARPPAILDIQLEKAQAVALQGAMADLVKRELHDFWKGEHRSMFQRPPVFLNPPDERRNDPKPGNESPRALAASSSHKPLAH